MAQTPPQHRHNTAHEALLIRDPTYRPIRLAPPTCRTCGRKNPIHVYCSTECWQNRPTTPAVPFDR
jgi:hypothetical protein